MDIDTGSEFLFKHIEHTWHSGALASVLSDSCKNTKPSETIRHLDELEPYRIRGSIND